MNEIRKLLSPERVLVNVKARCKREALSILAQSSADICGLDQKTVLETLQEREKLGSTGVGGGIAIPHGKLANIDEMIGLLVHLREPVEFDSVDDKPVDILFLLLAPEDASATHLKTLSRVARLLRNESVRSAMRGASTSEALYAIAIEKEKPHAA